MTQIQQKIRTSIFILIGTIVVLGGYLQPANAHTLSDDPAPGYVPSNLISNDQLTGYGYDGAGVVNFLQQRGSWLKGYVIPEYQEVPYKFRNSNGDCEWRSVSVRQHNDITNENLYGRLAGDLIANEGHDHGINPQVILVTLEKESTAISRSSVQSQPVEMWVLGYGWNDTMAGCGYNYDTARARAINFGGVGQQIAYATSGLRSLYNNATDWQTPFTTLDGVTVTAANQATRALYRYTPYTHTGNHNFWHYYTLWFQSVPVFSPTAYGWDEDMKPSIVYGGERWPFVDVESFESVIPGQAGFMPRLTASQLALPKRHTLGRIISKASSGQMFYLLNGKRRHINNDRVLALYGWNRGDVVGNVTDTFIDAIPVGDPLLPIIRVENSTATYLQTRGENHRITNQAEFKDNWNFDWSEVIEVPPYTVNTVPTTNNLGIIALSNEGTAYLIDKGRRYHIPDNSTAERWGLNWNTAVRFDTPLLWRFPEDWRLTPYARNEETGHVYVLEHGQRRWLSASRRSQLGISERDIVNHSAAFMNRIPEGSHF